MIKWTSRQWRLDHPVDMFPFIRERLYGTAPRIAEMTEGISTATLTRRKGEAWSIQEHIGHLIDLDALHEARLDDYLSHLPELRAADMTNRKTYEGNYNAQVLADLLARFRSARVNFIHRLEKIDLNLSALHPRLQQPMRVVDMAFFVAEHDDHHLAKMRELLAIA